MSKLPPEPDWLPIREPNWIPVSEALDRGVLVRLMEDCFDCQTDADFDNAPTYAPTANAKSAVIVYRGNAALPGVQLEDGRVLCLSWEQMFSLIGAFTEFSRMVLPALHGQEPARAWIKVPTND